MTNKLLHTPEGVRDVYNSECLRKTSLENRLLKLFQKFGYHPIQTPTFEFFDIFGSDVGTTPSKDLYKFFDREGNTLVLRPDITPSIARAVSKYFGGQPVVRLSYAGNVFINNNSYQGRLKESTQLGAECIGEGSLESDGEIIAMVVNSLKEAGLKEFQISIGHAGLFQGLMESVDFSDEEKDQVKHLIMNKNSFGLQEILQKRNVDADLLHVFTSLNAMFIDPKEWQDLLSSARPYSKVYEALSYLSELYEVLNIYGVSKYVSFELGLLTTHKYYTGIIFQGYTFGSGEPIVKGGRYDRLMAYFNQDAPAIGFAIELDQLLISLERQGLSEEVSSSVETVYYSKENRTKAIQYANARRESGFDVELILLKSETELESKREENSNETVTMFL